MEDRFKFRVFIPDANLMFYCGTFLPPINEIGKNTKLMQCTGLKDKNGKLIYEGDVLGGIYEDLYIHYCPNCMQFQLKADNYGCMACEGDIHWSELVEDNDDLEVIGNIYENADLFEREE